MEIWSTVWRAFRGILSTSSQRNRPVGVLLDSLVSCPHVFDDARLFLKVPPRLLLLDVGNLWPQSSSPIRRGSGRDPPLVKTSLTPCWNHDRANPANQDGMVHRANQDGMPWGPLHIALGIKSNQCPS